MIGEARLVRKLIRAYTRQSDKEKRANRLFRDRPVYWLQYGSSRVNLAVLNDCVAKLATGADLDPPSVVLCVGDRETLALLKGRSRIVVAEMIETWMEAVQEVLKESLGEPAFENIQFLWSTILPQTSYDCLQFPQHGEGVRKKLNLAITNRLTNRFQNVITVDHRNIKLPVGFAVDNKGADLSLQKVVSNVDEAVQRAVNEKIRRVVLLQ